MMKNKAITTFINNPHNAKNIINDLIDQYSWGKVAVVSEEIPLISALTVLDNIVLYKCYAKRLYISKVENEVLEFLNRYNEPNIIYLHKGQLNKYQQFIAKLARATIHNPEIIVINMPVDYLGIENFNLFVDILKESNTDLSNIMLIENDRFSNLYDDLDINKVGINEWLTHVTKILNLK